MADYAVVNPATGETVKEYPTISRRRPARTRSARADEAHRDWVAVDDGRRARGADPPRRRAARRAAPAARRDHRPRDGQADRAGARRGRLLRGDLRLLRRQRREADGRRADRRCSTARDRRWSAAARSASCSGSCRGTTPTTRWRGSPDPNLVIGNTILLKHAPQCPESAAAMEQIFHEAGFPPGRVHQHLRDQRADRVGDRRSARARRLADRLRARRRRRRRDRRAQPQEGRARARRLRSVHPAVAPTTSTPRSRRPSPRRLENTGQACNAAKRFIVVDELYEPFLEKFTAALTAVKPGDPTSADTTIGPLSSALATERLADQVEPRGRRRRQARRRRRATTATSSSRPC